MISNTFKKLFAALTVFGLIAAMTPTTALAQQKVHKIVLQVSDNDPKKMNIALNNAANVDAYYKAKGEEVIVQIVAYGPGLNMLVKGKSPVQARIKSFGQNFDNISFKACGNTLKKFKKKAGGKDVLLVPEAALVPAGVVQISELQEQGWTYVRP